MSKLFISHSSQDDGFVRELRTALGDHGQDGWIDSRELRGGDPLWPEIQQSIEEAGSYAVVISPASFQSEWVSDELTHAIEVQARRGRENFPVIPLLLDGAKLGVFKRFFGTNLLFIAISSAAGGVEAAVDPILVALGKREPADAEPTPQPKAEPLEELVLELTDLKFHEQDGVRRASARAQLVHEPAAPGQPHVHSAAWRFIALIGPIEAEELRWYLEKFAIWPSEYFRDRARKVEQSLVEWGRLLHDSALPVAHTADVLQAWARVDEHAGLRFSVNVDATLEAGVPKAEQDAAKEAATVLLGLPWELIHDGRSFLFQGARPTRVRRRIPNTEPRTVSVVSTPIRILLVTARPEDDSCGYIDHRISALPLVDAMETLPGLVRIQVLSPPTFDALGVELQRAFDAREPYHVVHFDGHGVYDRTVGLGGLCFEEPQDIGKLDGRRHATVFTDTLGPLLRAHRIPLVFLEACQTAMSEKASESVATKLLSEGVSSVVAMSHSVLVETARRFVETFYQALARGARVGDAMLAGQRRLKDDTFRARVFGVGELRLEDWFVPVLFQEKDDPQLFRETPARQTRDDFLTALKARLGHVPEMPATGFIGRSRDLLALQRLIRHERYAVIRGQGGEGKTALAAEFARWMVRSHQIQRAAFVSVEGLEKNIVESVLDKLGQQLVRPKFATAIDCQGDLGKAEQEIARVLREQSTVLIVDNMESILLPPFVEEVTPEALSAEAREELKELLELCARLNDLRDTRLVFTSREALPAPFDAARHRRELHRLDREDAVKFVERVLNADEGAAADAALDAARESIEELVNKVHGHARTLTLLAPSLKNQGAGATYQALDKLMVEMDRQYPPGSLGSREKSVFASVELSLRRMSPANRDKARVLGVFHGRVNLDVLRTMMESKKRTLLGWLTGFWSKRSKLQWSKEDVGSLADELIETGLATPNRSNHLTLNPALCPYLRGRMESTERDALTARWVEGMRAYAEFLHQQQSQNIEVAATLTVLELPNLFALLELAQRAGDAEATIDLATSLYSLLSMLGKPRLLERVGQVRDATAAALGDAWNHARFQAARTRIEQQLTGGRMPEAFEGARQLLQRARAAGGQAYPGAYYDLAGACWLLARVLETAGGPEQAVPLLDEARQRFEAVAKERPGIGAERMVSVCFADKGVCLLHLGRLDEAAAAFEEAIQRAEQLDDARQVAVGKGELGTVRMQQRRYSEALAAYADARGRFTQLDEPGTVAVFWHQTGMVYQATGQSEAAEDAYRKSLAIEVRLGNVAGPARTLSQLGTLYFQSPNRSEEAASFFRQAADKFAEIRDAGHEGVTRSNLAEVLRKLRRLDEARQEILRAIECKAQFGHTSAPWTSWSILADIETDAGNPATAAEAKRKAIACYLAYRRDGGENHNPDGRLCLAVTQPLLAGDSTAAASLLEELAANPDAAWLLPFIRALQAIVTGSRDRAFADAPELDHTMAAEILFLLETLEKAGR